MNLVARLHQLAAELPEQPALVDCLGGRDRCLRYGELSGQVEAVAGELHARGFRAGDALLVFHPVALELYLAILGAFHLGVVVVLADPSGGREFLQHVCLRTRPRGFFGSRRAHLLRWRQRELRRIPCSLHPRGWWPGSRALLGRLVDVAPCFEADPDHPALITFTSGSTGLPKAAVRTHEFLLDQHRTLETALALEPGQRDLVTLPVFALANLASGVTSVIADCDLGRPGDADPARIAAQCRRWSVTRVTAAPAFCEALLRGGKLPGFSRVFTGGGPVFPDLLDRLAAAAPGLEATAVYGSTEAEPIAELPAREIDGDVRAAIAAGRGLPAGHPVLDLAILPDRSGQALGPFDPDDFESLRLPPGQTGEIVVAGPQVLRGYLDGVGDEETKIRVGDRVWHRTGDAGCIDDHDRLWLLGRCAAKIRRPDGTATYPFAIEAALRATFPTIRTAALEHEGRLLLAGEGALPAGFEAAARTLGCERIISLPVIPVDRRHQSKIDYPALHRVLSSELVHGDGIEPPTDRV